VLWVWIKKSLWDAWLALYWLFVPPPPSYKPPVPHRVISPNTDCPACGNASGKIECVPMIEATAPGVVIRHTCNICGANWHEATVIKGDDPSVLFPSLNSLT